MHVREQIKLCHRTEENSIILFNFRASMMRPGEWHEEEIAKFTYVQSTGRWKLFWMPSFMKWVKYSKLPEAGSFEELFLEVEADPICCF